LNKKLIAILTLVMFALTLLPMGAFAATTNSALQIRTIAADSNQVLGNLRIAETEATRGSVASGHEITFRLTNNAKWQTNPTSAQLLTAFGTPTNFDVPALTDFSNITNTSFTLKVARTGASLAGNGIYTVDFGAAGMSVDTTDVTEGSVGIEIYSVHGGITNTTVTLATIPGGTTTATALSVENIQRGKNNQEIGAIRIVESKPGALASGKNLDLVLPDGFTWSGGIGANNGDYNYSGAFAGTPNTAFGTVGTTNSNLSRLRLTITSASTITPGVITITGLKVDAKDDVSLGDMAVSVGGDATSQSLVLAKVEDYGYELSVDSMTTFYAGDDEQKIANFWLKELAKESIVGNGRTIKITLPSDMAWLEVPASISTDSGTFVKLETTPTYESDRKTVIYSFESLAPTLSTSKAAYKFKDFKVAVKATATEKDVVLTFSGTAGVAGELKVGEIKKPVTVTAEASDIVIGKQNQKVGDILIKEVKAGYIETYTTNVSGANVALEVVVDYGLTLSNTPTVEVVDGDLKIGKVSKDGSKVIIKTDKASTVPSTIKITNAMVDVNRTPAEGDYEFKVIGSALNKIGSSVPAAGTDTGDTRIALDAKSTDAVVKFVGAVVVTPAPDQEGVVKPVTMTVGSTVYTVGGVEMTMDVAPYIKNSRTYFPVRYVANALNITNDNVVWDGAQRTVTIFKGNRIVQVTIGSTTMLVNGVPLTMDVAPEITAERTMLPIRFVAQGLGATVDFDAATQTVTLR
jgi:hypothetical protein